MVIHLSSYSWPLWSYQRMLFIKYKKSVHVEMCVLIPCQGHVRSWRLNSVAKSDFTQWLSYIYTFSSLCVLKSNEYQIWYFDSEINDFSVFNSCHAFIPKILIKLVSLLVMSCDQNAGVTSLISSTYLTRHRELFVNNSTHKIKE